LAVDFNDMARGAAITNITVTWNSAVALSS
jgi:hypothetical protein